MLAINHVSLATATVLGLSIYYDHPFFLPLIVFVIFAALLPDIDHNKSEISQLIPVVNRFFGHRSFTHSILGTATFALIVYFSLGSSVYISYALLAAGFIGLYYLRKLLLARTHQFDALTRGFFSRKQLILFVNITAVFLVLMGTIAAFTVWEDKARMEIAILLLLGYVNHLFGDFITKEGIPLLWPWKHYFGLRIFRTGSNFETFLGILLAGANVYLTYLFWIQFHVSDSIYWLQYIPSKFLSLTA